MIVPMHQNEMHKRVNTDFFCFSSVQWQGKDVYSGLQYCIVLQCVKFFSFVLHKVKFLYYVKNVFWHNIQTFQKGHTGLQLWIS